MSIITNNHGAQTWPRKLLERSDIWTGVFVAALTCGAVLRFRGIGRYGFWTDELFHVFAATSYLNDGSFSVPWLNGEYTRALPITLITALEFRLFGQSEASARFLFALTNVLFIALGYLVIRRLFSRTIAVVFVVSMSFSVYAIQLSQEARMYTVFQLFYFLMSVAFFRGLEYGPERRWLKSSDQLWEFQQRHCISFGSMSAALFCGLAALSVQPLVFNFGFVVVAYAGLALWSEENRLGFRSALYSKYSMILCLVVMALAVVLLAVPDRIIQLWNFAIELPNWQRTGQSRFDFYRHILQEPHPILWTLSPLGMFAVIYRYGKVGLFFTLSFVVPFLLHSFIFQRTAERYIFYLLPFFVTVSATAIAFLTEAMRGHVSHLFKTLSQRQRWALVASGSISVGLIAYPMLVTVLANSAVARFPNWKELDGGLIREVSSHRAITTDRMRFNYYFKRYPDFVLGVEDPPGEKILTDLAGVSEVVLRYPEALLVTYQAHFYNDSFVSPEIREYVTESFKRLDDGQDDARIMVFGRLRAGPTAQGTFQVDPDFGRVLERSDSTLARYTKFRNHQILKSY